MRLICPNCDSEYEVDDSMIPAEGRDVQCSNCMNTWFQIGPSQAEPETEEDLDLPPLDAERSNPSPSYLEDDDDDDVVEGVPPAAIAALAEKRRSAKIDPEALQVIQDEVTREQNARQADATALETQIDLGLDESESSGAASARARLTAQADEIVEEAQYDDETEMRGATKRELLPDIEEINSTLAEAPDPDEFDDDFAPVASRSLKARSRSGFRLGFGLMLMVSAALVGIYVYAPAFSQSVPAVSGFLDGYVSAVNAMRVWLDRSAQDLVDQITNLLASVNQP